MGSGDFAYVKVRFPGFSSSSPVKMPRVGHPVLECGWVSSYSASVDERWWGSGSLRSCHWRAGRRLSTGSGARVRRVWQ